MKWKDYQNQINVTVIPSWVKLVETQLTNYLFPSEINFHKIKCFEFPLTQPHEQEVWIKYYYQV